MKVNYKLTPILFSISLISMVFIIFKSSLGYEFVWDDREIIVNNLNIRELNFESLLWAFTNTLGGHYQPLTWLSFICDYYFWGLQSYGYRLTNILMHATNAVLLMLIINSILIYFYKFKANYITVLISSIIGALIFSCHPLRVESVVWITERRDVLSVCFLLISFLAYFNSRFCFEEIVNQKYLKNSLYVISFFSFSLSLLCKAWGITFPLVLILVDIAICRPETISSEYLKSIIKPKIPYIIISFVFAIIGINAAGTSGAMVTWNELTLTDRVLQASYGFNMYLFHTLFPENLSPLYLLGKTNFYDIKFYTHFFIFISIFIFSILIYKKCHWPFFMFLIYLVIVFPVLGFSQSGPQIMADRYSYLSTMPFYIGGSFIILKAINFSVNQTGLKKTIYISTIIILCIAIIYSLLSKTKEQIIIWENEEVLWSRAIDVDSLNYRAISNRADYRVKRKDYYGAIEDYSTVLDIYHRDAYALNGRASAKIYLGDLNGAVGDLNAALTIVPDNIDILLNRGVAYNNLGKPELARKDFQAIIKNQPDYLKANFYLGVSYYYSNDYHSAIDFFTKTINADFEHIDSRYYRGLSFAFIGNKTEAKKDFEYIMFKLDKNTVLYKNAEYQFKLLNKN